MFGTRRREGVGAIPAGVDVLASSSFHQVRRAGQPPSRGVRERCFGGFGKTGLSG